MKISKLIIIGMAMLLGSVAQAQFSMSINLRPPPPWGPVGYTSVQYYYLPDVEAYYDVQSTMFIYYSGGIWVHRAYLPTRYKNYDLYTGYKVVMNDYHGKAPYEHFKEHKMKYGKGYHGEAQRTIGERPGKGHSGEKHSHEGYHDNNGGGGDKGNGEGHGNDKNNHKDHGHDDGNGKKK
jgi:hypothetical protein